MRTTPNQLYEADFYAWTRQQATELRRFAKSRPNLPLDLEHIAEEIRDLGKSERDAVFSLAQRIIEHLLLIIFARGGSAITLVRRDRRFPRPDEAQAVADHPTPSQTWSSCGVCRWPAHRGAQDAASWRRPGRRRAARQLSLHRRAGSRRRANCWFRGPPDPEAPGRPGSAAGCPRRRGGRYAPRPSIWQPW